jgi:large subunit ribosomal protein L13
MRTKFPERIVEIGVKGMLPKTKLGRAMYKKLFVYKGSNHPHAAQKPEVLNLNVNND